MRACVYNFGYSYNQDGREKKKNLQAVVIVMEKEKMSRGEVRSRGELGRVLPMIDGLCPPTWARHPLLHYPELS